jgi:recombination associated protein RdgC
MFFRNLTLFRFPTTTKLDALDTGLDECQLKPVGGFVSPYGRDNDLLAARQRDAIWLAVGGEDRLLPGSVVNDMLAKKLAEIEQKEGRKPGGRTRKRIKDELITDLLPRAFVKPSRTDALLDLEHGIVVVDTSSRKNAENVVSEIRRALGSFPALPLNAEVAPRSVLTGWIAGEPLPDGLSLGDECELRDPVDQGAVVKCQRQELQGDEIGKHLEAGKQVTRLALTLDDHVSFVLGEDMIVRKFKLLDGAVDQLESTDREDLRAELDARFALMSGEAKRLFAVLEKALKLSKAEA